MLNAVVRSTKPSSRKWPEPRETLAVDLNPSETAHPNANGNAAHCSNVVYRQPPMVLTPGVQLVREWNGRTWQVEVLEDGFACNGKTYRSLSTIARMITGTRWSGPRFFGLRS